MQQIDLAGDWTLVRPKTNDELPVAVPGDNVAALLRAGHIPHPYHGMNEFEVQWIGREDWWFRRTFEVDRDTLGQTCILLNFDSLDTVADVFVNGHRVGDADNMFRRYRFNVKDVVREGTNTLEIRFASPERAAARKQAAMPYPIPCSGAPVHSPHRNMNRKVQCHAGWDWGCCLMVSGIYGQTYLAATSDVIVEHVYTEQVHDSGQCRVTVTAELTSCAAGAAPFEVTLGEVHREELVELTEGRNTVSTEVTVNDPKLWWPNGYGEQPLYELTVRVGSDTCRKRLGLRTVELITEEDDTGLSFWFKVNGTPVFCKGANWIPTDAMPAQQTRDVYDNLLTSAAAAHMNMLRVWGGGQYEQDAFYELCDDKGILIWHDFMFSCSLYPATPDFLDNVRAEVTYQVKRLRDHACIALWCGNNENLGALNWYRESREQRDRYLVDYDRLNEGAVGATADLCDPTRTFWPSSPSGGRGDYSDCFHDDSRGDMHYWHVWHRGMSFDAYFNVTPRFCSEFGYQSFPTLATVRTYAGADDMNVTSPVMEHHQRNDGGNSKIVEMFTRYFRIPNGFDNFVYLSQVQQAVAIKTAVEYWRHLRPTCMGTLYWQLNDNWPVCSWASVEYGGNWKLLHYAARRFYQPLLLTCFQKDGELQVWVVNDHPATDVPVSVNLRVRDFDGNVLSEETLAHTARAADAEQVRTHPVSELISDPAAGYLELKLTQGGDILARNTHVFTEYKRCPLREPKIQVKVTDCGDGGGPLVSLTADKPAFFVSLFAEGIGGTFSDNCITLVPDEERILRCDAGDEVDAETLEKALKIYHLRGTYA